MTFASIGRKERFPRNEHVDIIVQQVTLNADAPDSAQVEAVEIREYIKSGDVFSHGIVIPRDSIRDLIVALKRVIQTEDK